MPSVVFDVAALARSPRPAGARRGRGGRPRDATAGRSRWPSRGRCSPSASGFSPWAGRTACCRIPRPPAGRRRSAWPHTPGGDDGFLAGEPLSIAAWAAASRRLGARPLLLAPTLRPGHRRIPRSRSLIAWLWGRPQALAGRDPVAGGFDPRPGRGARDRAPARALVDAGRGRRRGGGRWRWPWPAADGSRGRAGRRGPERSSSMACAIVAGARTPVAPAELIGVLLLDAVPWVVLGVIGLWSQRDPAALGLASRRCGRDPARRRGARRCRRRRRALPRRTRPGRGTR